MQHALFYPKHTDKFTSPKHNLLVFQVKTNSSRLTPTGKSASQFQTPATFLQQSCSSVANLSGRYCSKSSFLLFSCILLKYVLLSYFYHSKSDGLRTSRIQPPRKFVGQLQEKRLAHLAHCTESRNVLKTGQQEKFYPPIDVSVPLHCQPQLLSVKFENLVHSIFRNENLTMEINVSYIRVLYWQQLQSPASAPD